jgi:hypothetical protein
MRWSKKEIEMFEEVDKIVKEEIMRIEEEKRGDFVLKGPMPKAEDIKKDGESYVLLRKKVEEIKKEEENLRDIIIGYLIRIKEKFLEAKIPLEMQVRPIITVNEEKLQSALTPETWEDATKLVRIPDISKMNQALRDKKFPPQALRESLEISISFPLVPKIPKWDKAKKKEKKAKV